MYNDSKLYVIHTMPYLIFESDFFTYISPNNHTLGMQTSDTLDNRAYDNNLIAEYSTMYWAWKNDIQSKYIGFFHHRRYISLNSNVTNNDLLDIPSIPNKCNWSYPSLESIFTNYDLILPPKYEFAPISVLQQYNMCHDSNCMQLALNLINEKYPQMTSSFSTALSKTSGYYCNLYITKREIFNDYMTFIFDIFDSIRPYLQLYQPKLLAYLGERLFNGYIEYLITQRGIKVIEMPRVFITNANETYNITLTSRG